MDSKVQCGKKHRPNHRGQKTKDNHNGEVSAELNDGLSSTNNEEQGTSEERVLQNVQILKLNLDQPGYCVNENTHPLMR